MPADNPLISDRDVAFLLDEVHDVAALCRLPVFAEHDRETFELFLGNARALAREHLYPAYRPMDAEPPAFVEGRIRVHPRMRALWPRLVELGVLTASRPASVGGAQLPRAVAILAEAYLMAANLGAYGFAGLTAGAAHLIEAFGDAWLRERFMRRMYAGEWTGTMALTEPHAGSSLADLRTRATPAGDGTYLVQGGKIFISGGDHDLADNVVHLTLARLDGAPAGVKGISLLAIPRLRPEGERLVDNDVSTAGMIHKIGWRGLPSLVINFGERGACRGWLVGEPGHGLGYMFQMMNEARLMVGLNGVATASVAYHEALRYARERRQGRPPGRRDPTSPPVPIIEHADVRRMLLRQKAIVEGGLCLLVHAAQLTDLAAHAEDPDERRRSALLLDLLTPIAKSFAAERGFESNALALQIHGGYGYSSEYLPEAWLRDQKLNSIHEGTTTIQGLDLLGRKVVAQGGAALRVLADEIAADLRRAADAGVPALARKRLAAGLETLTQVTTTLGMKGAAGDLVGMLGHSADFLTLASIVVVGWMWVKLEAALGARDDAFARGLRAAATYFSATELPRVAHLAALCESNEPSYLALAPDDL